MKKIGVDGCKGGWLAAIKDDTGKITLDVYPTIKELWQAQREAESIAIDIPIGFRCCSDESEERACDKEARKALGQPRGSSVFVVPCREAIYAKTYDEASRINFECTGRKIPVFSWGIMPKICEVDVFLQSNEEARKIITEIHPEVCFWGLAGKKPMKENKKKWDGTRERIEVLLPFLPDVKDVLLHGMTTLKGKAVADDILDALAALVTIDGGPGSLLKLPRKPENDSTGLPMSMAYRF